MRFYVAEHKELIQEIESAGFEKERFSFSKKGGVVFITADGCDRPFSFHRKKETILDQNNQWVKKTTYHFDKPSKASLKTDWEGIVFGFKIWLKGIDQKH